MPARSDSDTWIRTIPEGEAEGRLGKSYAAAVRRAGRVFGIIKTMSLSPAVLEASFALYQRVMFAGEGLARYQREMLAVVVSRANDCHY
ncbi:MAG: peroxidase [Planctomycetota bacterium]|nr:MAG: peroxidase [Planctomycetota bacterium]